MLFKNTKNHRFSVEQCDALFETVLINDVIDADTHLPDKIHLNYSQEELINCFDICRQVWELGMDRRQFGQLIKSLYQQRDLNTEDRLIYKHVRAKFKQLRFAFANFDERHRYPKVFHGLTSLMGQLQDDFKMSQRTAVAHASLLLRFCLTKIPFLLIEREVRQFRPSSVASFQQYTHKGVNFIRSKLAKPEITARDFHSIRKVISRQTSFYIALVTLYPSHYHHQIFRHLSAINGMMGQMHDVLVEKEVSGAQDYHADTFKIPDDIRQLLEAAVSRYD